MHGIHGWYLAVVCSCLLGYGMLVNSGCGSKDKCTLDSDCLAGQFCRMEPTVGAKTCQSGAVSDACLPTCTAGQACISGKCVTLCTPACSAQEACVQGKCVAVTTDCNPACTGQTKCVSGTCILDPQEPARESVSPREGTAPEEPPPAQESSTQCNSDRDCASGLRCQQGRCVAMTDPENANEAGTEATSDDAGHSSESTTESQPTDQVTSDAVGLEGSKPCTQSSDCPSGQSCQNGSCVPTGGCGAGCQENQQCVNGRCEAEQNSGIGQVCSVQAPCPSGLTCLDLGPNVSRCLQKCTNSGDCANNTLRKVCLQLTATDSFCVQIATIGQKCGLETKVQAICDNQSVCQDGSCTKPVEVKPQESCGSGGRVCPKDHLCIRFSSGGGSSSSYCMSQCTPGGTACTNNATCEALGPSFGFCLPTGSATNDDLCGSQTGGTSFDTSRVCQKGLDCVSLIQAVCLKFANGDCATSKLTCPPDRKCQDLHGPQSQKFSICTKVCSKDAECGKNHMQCQSGTCWPKAPTGNVPYAEPCKSFGNTNELCQSGLSCFYLGSSSSSGYCSKSCQTDADCPAAKDAQGQSLKAVCMVNSNVCGFICGIGQSCPNKLQCVQNQFCGP